MDDEETLARAREESFRSGVRAAVQAVVDDIAGLVQRRERAMANKDTTNIIAGIGRRLATLPVPQREGDALPAISREVLFAKVAQKIRPDLDWSNVASLTVEGFFVDDQGMVVEGNAQLLAAWRFAESLVEMIRYA